MIVPIVRSSQYYYDRIIRIIDLYVTTVLVCVIHFKTLNFNIMEHNIFLDSEWSDEYIDFTMACDVFFIIYVYTFYSRKLTDFGI